LKVESWKVANPSIRQSMIRCFLPLLCALGLVGCSRAKIDRVEWPVMGTIAAVQLKGELTPDGGRLTADVMAAFNDVSDALNAHVATSEISSLASFADEEVLSKCDAKTKPCYEAAFSLMRESGGAFNPRWKGQDMLDLGAIAKGFAVDLAAKSGMSGRDSDILIDLGGNVKALRGSWRTGVMNPGGGGFAAVVDLREGEALATSATYYRGSHIYDGRTGLAVSNCVASVTVLCSSAMWADGLSTTLFVLGPDEGRAFVEEKGERLMGGGKIAILWILSDGRQVKLDPDSRFSAR
jgi:thiamine biosynthesis lipoprotein